MSSNGTGPRERRLADALGIASLGLGVPQTVAPERFDRFVGIEPDEKARTITRVACGVRELGAAAGILGIERERPVRTLWARVAGDVLDLTLLARALRSRPQRPGRIVAAMGGVVGVAAADVYTAVKLTQAEGESERAGGLAVRAATTVRRPPDEVRSFWHSHWKSQAPLDRSGWDVDFRPAPRDQGTEVHVSMSYSAPGGSFGAAIAKLAGQEPRQQVKDDLRRFKQVMETGEVVRSEGTPEGQAAPRYLKQRPAQPPGSDLHLYNGFIPTVKRGDIFGHEFMGEVVETGPDVANLSVGDRVVVPFPIACGNCNACQAELYSVCENSNPNAGIAEKLMGHSPCGIFGYSHMMGGFAGGQAEYARVPFADVGPLKVENGFTDEQVLFLSDVFPTGFMGAELCDISPGDVIAVWGCGPVGQFAIAGAKMLGAERVIAIDRFDYRLRMAMEKAGATEVIDYEEQPDVVEQLKEMTGGRGPDACIDAVGLEGHHAHLPIHAYDRVKQMARIHPDRPHALREAILACRNGGTVSVMGAYAGFMDKFPIGAVMNRSLTIKSGQCHVQRYLRPLMERIERGDIDPSFVVTHTMSLDDAPEGYEKFLKKEDGCVKVVLKP